MGESMDDIINQIIILNKSVVGAIINKQHPKKISYSQAKILIYLHSHQNNNVCQKDLQEELQMKKASITEALNYLENKDLIKRISCENDKRKNYIVLTQKALDIKDSMQERISYAENIITKGISEEQLISFKETVNVMLKNIKERVDV